MLSTRTFSLDNELIALILSSQDRISLFSLSFSYWYFFDSLSKDAASLILLIYKSGILGISRLMSIAAFTMALACAVKSFNFSSMPMSSFLWASISCLNGSSCSWALPVANSCENSSFTNSQTIFSILVALIALLKQSGLFLDFLCLSWQTYKSLPPS